MLQGQLTFDFPLESSKISAKATSPTTQQIQLVSLDEKNDNNKRTNVKKKLPERGNTNSLRLTVS